MYSYVIEFNLKQRGDEAEDYLAEAARTWPKLWGDVPGVTGTLLLSSALALGGEFEYQWRVDLERLATLARIDELMKSDHQWQRTRRRWFRARTVARAHLSRHIGGDEAYCAEQKGVEGAVHFVLHAPSAGSDRTSEQLDAVRSAPGVVSSQQLAQVAGSAVSAEQTWVRLESLDRLDDVANLRVGEGFGRLYGELREVEGSLFAGA